MTIQPLPRPLRIATPELELSGWDYGNPKAPPLVLVHGIRDLAWSLHRLAHAFCRDYHVVSLDLRGHGDSDKPGIYTPLHYVADLYNVLTQLGLERPVLVGHSLGAQIVAQYAAISARAPAAAILIEGLGPPRHPSAGEAHWRRQVARSQVEALATNNFGHRRMPDLETATRRFLQKHPRLDPAWAAQLVARATTAHPRGGLQWKWDPRVQNTWAFHRHEESEERWGWIECPVLVVTAERSGDFWVKRRELDIDPSVHMNAAEVGRRVACFRDAHHVEIPDAGHMVHFDEPARLESAVAGFLAALGPRTSAPLSPTEPLETPVGESAPDS